MNSYREQALKAVYSIIVSLNILGNPSKIAREFSGGIDNLLDNHGDDSVKVIAEGAGVIAKNSMAGYFPLTQHLRRPERVHWQSGRPGLADLGRRAVHEAPRPAQAKKSQERAPRLRAGRAVHVFGLRTGTLRGRLPAVHQPEAARRLPGPLARRSERNHRAVLQADFRNPRHGLENR